MNKRMFAIAALLWFAVLFAGSPVEFRADCVSLLARVHAAIQAEFEKHEAEIVEQENAKQWPKFLKLRAELEAQKAAEQRKH